MPETSISHPNSVDVILMASGFSRRFGTQNKLLQPFSGKPLVRYPLELVCSMDSFENIFFVYAEAEVAAIAQEMPVTLLHNTQPQRGSCESIRLGVSASNAAYYLFMQCDQPLLDEKTLLAILNKRRPGCITVPTYNGRHRSPVLFSSRYREELLHLENGQNAREIKAKHAEKVVEVVTKNFFALEDVDTPQQLSQLEALVTGAIV